MHNPPLILIVDDSPDFRTILASKLKANGFWIAEAMNGEEALARAITLHPDLIIMDVNMPKANGTEALLDLRQNPETKDIKLMFWSSLKNPWPLISKENSEFAKELGALDFIPKDDDLDEMLKKIRVALGMDKF